jgi:hypothetical protein
MNPDLACLLKRVGHTFTDEAKRMIEIDYESHKGLMERFKNALLKLMNPQRKSSPAFMVVRDS